MAHLVENMAYAGQVPWHGLGFQIDPDASIEDWQKAAGLDWEVKKAAVEFQNGERHIMKDTFVLYRDSDSRPMSVISTRYKPVQPAEILEFYRDLISMHGMKIETAGSLKDGKRIWALAKTGEVHKVLGTDQVEGYLLLATSYDGTFATLAQFTSVRVVCNNTLQLSFNNHGARITVPHFREFNAEAVKNQLGIGHEAWQAFTSMAEVLARTKLDEGKAKDTISNVFRLPLGIPTPDELVKQAVDRAHADNVFQLFMGKARGADLAGQTAWGLVNAVTEYVDHGKRARGQGNRLDSAWFGEGANIKQRAWDEAQLLAA